MRFTKMHGIGNDYIFVDTAQETVEDPASLARAISDRHTGAGSDGLILIGPPTDSSCADARMRMFNADGSEAEMCGNGIRCVAKFVVDRGLSGENPLRIETGRGVLEVRWLVGCDGLVDDVEVDMGAPMLESAAMGVRWSGVDGTERIVARRWPGADLLAPFAVEPTATVVSMGNPHIIFWAKDVAAVPLESFGASIERHEFFPQRINVHIVEVQSPRELRMRTWERGSGITRACGTGASAVCVAGVLESRSDRAVVAHLPGGTLALRWDETSGRVLMRGAATHVFDGKWNQRTAGLLHGA
ncbi:MAG: diaminopimelate epimerase [Phycisphaerales bacterium]|nr:diaminopimelate epimerase [Phycisphaerales bacterium]